MSNLYTEEQYKQYLHFMGRIGCNFISVSVDGHISYKEWIKEEGLSPEAVKQMEDQLEQETFAEMKRLP